MDVGAAGLGLVLADEHDQRAFEAGGRDFEGREVAEEADGDDAAGDLGDRPDAGR